MNESKNLSKIIWDFIKEVESDYGKYMSAADCDLLANKIIQAAGPRAEVSERIKVMAEIVLEQINNELAMAVNPAAFLDRKCFYNKTVMEFAEAVLAQPQSNKEAILGNVEKSPNITPPVSSMKAVRSTIRVYESNNFIGTTAQRDGAVACIEIIKALLDTPKPESAGDE